MSVFFKLRFVRHTSFRNETESYWGSFLNMHGVAFPSKVLFMEIYVSDKLHSQTITHFANICALSAHKLEPLLINEGLQSVLKVLKLYYSTFIRRRQSSGFYRHLLGPVSDHVLINRASKWRALHQVIKYSCGTI